jgi:NitT/TauT family transport system substrate-binding protein
MTPSRDPETASVCSKTTFGDDMHSRWTRAASRVPTAILAIASLLAACSGPAASSSPITSLVPEASATPPPSTSAPSASAATASASPKVGSVRLALDWTPNTNHTGFYVAEANGWYKDAGVDLKILPYGTTAPEALIAAGQTECGISFQDALTFASAGGAPIVSVMAILQHTAQEIAVLASSDIRRPRQLDGKTYAGFGYPNEVPTLQAVIRADGGKGDFKSVTLETAAYEALYAKRADFVITFAAWEGLEAKERGIDLRTFKFGEYGFPDFYQVVLACDPRWLQKEPDLARRFVAATVRGFQLADTSPDEAAALLVAQNPGVFDANPSLPKASQEFLAAGNYLVDEDGAVGRQTLAEWQGYSSFLFDQHLLTGRDGKPLATAPDYASLFTNDYLP